MNRRVSMQRRCSICRKKLYLFRKKLCNYPGRSGSLPSLPVCFVFVSFRCGLGSLVARSVSCGEVVVDY